MWVCPICKEAGDDFDPSGHRHYLIEFLPSNGNDDSDHFGAFVQTMKIDAFVATVTSLTDIKGGSRSTAIESLEHIIPKLPSFPVPLRDFLRVCLGHQSEGMTEDGEGMDIDRLMSDVNDHIDNVIEHFAINAGWTYLSNPDDPYGDLAPANKVYWAEDPGACALDCAQRLGEEIRQLKRLRLRGSKYVVDH